MWMTRAGSKGAEIDLFLNKGVIAIGYSPLVGDLRQYRNRDELMAKYAAINPGSEPSTYQNAVVQMDRFKSEFQLGDIVTTYQPEIRAYHIGKVTGDYSYSDSEHPEFHHFRKVEWLGKISRDDLSQSSRNSLGSTLTIFEIPDAVEREMLSLFNPELLAGAEVQEEEEVRSPNGKEIYRRYGRGDAEAAENVFQRIFPSASNQAAAEAFLSECVRRAHRNHPNNWQITKGQLSIRLNVGFAKILRYDRQKVQFFLLGSLSGPALREKYKVEIEFADHFKSLNVETGRAVFNPDRLESVIGDLKEAVFGFLDLNSRQSKTSVWADSHSPGILKYLRTLSTEPIPSPEFESEYVARMELVAEKTPEFSTEEEADLFTVLPKELNPEYTLDEFARESGFPESRLAPWVNALERKGQAVFFGPPGTGKTYVAKRLAKHIIGGGDGFLECIQFHPGYSYEEFMEGIRPTFDTAGAMRFEVKAGRFLDFCRRAAATQDPCVLIIDEMNRANLSKVFGELMHLLEYRDTEMALAGGKRFSIPNNVRIIGTMNTADRSIALVDFALRRRFAFLELAPEYEVLSGFHRKLGFDAAPLVRILQEANGRINDKNFHLGVSFFMVEKLDHHIEGIWRMEIEPYLEEYFFGQPDAAEAFRWDKIQSRLRD